MSDQKDTATLVQARYGGQSPSSPLTTTTTETTPPPPLPPKPTALPSNPTITTILAHGSVRAFLPDSAPLPDGYLELLVAAGQSAATSSNLQTWSVVAVTDASIKNEAADLAGSQAFIRAAPLFLVFCADLQRLTAVSALRGTAGAGLEYTDTFLMATIDAALAAQNVTIAAESLGLGTCYVGAVRNKPQQMAELLKLPERVIALFGLAVGRPDPAHRAHIKPRLCLEEVLHREGWGRNASGGQQNGQEHGGAVSSQQEEHFRAYDDTLASYNAGEKREGVPAWTERSAQRIAGPETLSGRHILRDVLSERGFVLR